MAAPIANVTAPQPIFDQAFIKRDPGGSIAQELARYDGALELRWSRELERWVLFWRHQDGGLRYLCTVANEDGSYRPADSRILSWLQQRDSHRFFDDWESDGRKNFMRSLGMAEFEADSYLEDYERQAEERYQERFHILHEKARHVLKKDWQHLPNPTAAQLDRMDRRRGHLEDVAEAYRIGKGRIVLDRELGCGRVVSD